MRRPRFPPPPKPCKDSTEPQMSKRLYVGNLSWNVSDEDLREVFQQDGRQVVDARVITDRETGRSRGFGFVTYNDADSATRAIEELDGSQLDGRSIRVDRANDRPQRERGSTARW